jgi:hypothetical protein
MRWIIENVNDRDLYWSNELGWANRASATPFAEHEAMRFSLPIEGRWVTTDLRNPSK